MKREIRKRHTKEGGSRRKRDRQTRKKQRGNVDWYNPFKKKDPRQVKSGQWRIHRKYSRVNYGDDKEFDFENYDNEYKGDKIIHVLSKGTGNNKEFAIQVLDVIEMKRPVNVGLSEKIRTDAQKQENKERWDKYFNKVNEKLFNKLYKNYLNKKIHNKDTKLLEIVKSLDESHFNFGTDLNFEWRQLVGKRNVESTDIEIETLKEFFLKKLPEFLIKKEEIYYATWIIYYINIICEGDLVAKLPEISNSENIFFSQIIKKSFEDVNFQNEWKNDKDYEWLKHWVDMGGLDKTSAPDNVAVADPQWVQKQKGYLQEIWSKVKERKDKIKSENFIKKIDNQLNEIKENMTKEAIEKKTFNLMKLPKLDEEYIYDREHGVIVKENGKWKLYGEKAVAPDTWVENATTVAKTE